jgi:putative membrane protein
MLRQIILASALLLVAAPAMAQKANPSPAKASRVTTAFVKNASVGSKFAVDSSRLAAEKAQNPDVKSLAQRLADDYGKKSDELKQITQQAGMQTTDPVLDSRRASIMRRLQTMPAGPKFDRTYIDAQATAHNRAIPIFRLYSKLGDNPELKQFAASNLQALQDNQKQIRSLRAIKTSKAEKHG